MELLYLQEHLLCNNYDRGSRPSFENFNLQRKGQFGKQVEEGEIFFIMQGSLSMKINNKKYVHKQGDIVLLPPASNMSLIAYEDIKILIMRIKTSVHLCHVQPLERIFEKGHVAKEDSVALAANERIVRLISLLSDCLNDGLRCKCFTESKSKEIFYYFRAYYNRDALRDFFSPLLTKDYKFKIFIFQNHRKIKTVQQFADLYGYSLSSFEKQFKKTFNVSAYQWMTEQKSKRIYHDLIYTDVTLIELADDYDFSSLSQFCDFCKRVLGSSPGKIRNEKRCENTFTAIMNK